MRGIALSLLVLCSAASHGFDYCTLNSICKRGRHTMCTHTTEDPAQLCVNYVEHFLSSREKKEILKKHNELRSLIARGEVPNQPKGLDVKDLAWSEEDELIAKRWALQCTYEHDKCRNTKDGQWAGQNLGISGSPDGFTGDHLAQVQDWFDEHKKYKPGKGNLFPDGGVKGVGHYTMMVWGKTTHVGCERTYFHYTGLPGYGKLPGVEYLVCVYSPGGNVAGKQVYQTGSNEDDGDGNTHGGHNNTHGSHGNKTAALGVKQESCVFMLLVSLVLALKLNLFTGGLSDD